MGENKSRRLKPKYSQHRYDEPSYNKRKKYRSIEFVDCDRKMNVLLSTSSMTKGENLLTTRVSNYLVEGDDAFLERSTQWCGWIGVQRRNRYVDMLVVYSTGLQKVSATQVSTLHMYVSIAKLSHPSW